LRNCTCGLPSCELKWSTLSCHKSHWRELERERGEGEGEEGEEGKEGEEGEEEKEGGRRRKREGAHLSSTTK
jgi:hypothetical protein